MSAHSRISSLPEDPKRQKVDPLVNPLNGSPLTDRYFSLLETRKRLPVYEFFPEIEKTVNDYQVVIIEGETGSGKTTQIPQPRRVAATTVAQRVAQELDVPLGKEVGYTIRFEDLSGPETILKFVTDGILLREAMGDPVLSRYSIVLLDEAHERTLDTDILMGLLKQMLPKRPDLKLIVMSATLDAVRFKDYFPTAPLIHIPGRAFPVEVFYTAGPEQDYVSAAIRTVMEIHSNEPPGDILVFLTGQEEINDVCEKLRQNSRKFPLASPLLPLPLYSTLPPQQQQQVFQPAAPKRPGDPVPRKVVVATNIAETSITIEGIVYVVDSGFAKQKLYDPRVRVESLLVCSISKASAKQRAGRAGRTRPGKCFRLYPQIAFETDLQDQTYPEILRSNLSSVVLTLKRMRIDNLVRFDFMDPPAPATLMRALELLHFLGALTSRGDLTPLGKLLADFPLDPQLAKVLLSAPKFHCFPEILTIVSMLSVPHPFIRPKEKSQEADGMKQALSHCEGDHLTLLKAYQSFIENQQSSDWCFQHFVDFRSMRQAVNIRDQLEQICSKHAILVDDHMSPSDPEYFSNIQKCILSGFFMQVALISRGDIYTTAKDNQVVKLHPSTVLQNSPSWVLFNELVQTSAKFIRTCTAIEPEWLLEIAPHYYDLENFPRGEMRRALISTQKKMMCLGK